MLNTFAQRPRVLLSVRKITCQHLSTSAFVKHENPLGLPRSGDRLPPTMPKRGGGPPVKRSIPYAKKVIVVASGKGGVGKSSVAVNLAIAMAQRGPSGSSRVGLLDLDIFGPSVPKLMGLEDVGEPELTRENRLLPMTNHGIPCMSMGFLLPPSASGSNVDTAVVWRGLMVQKAVQQLLFEVDWRGHAGNEGPDLDVLVVDMPPGTGDVQLTLGQLVKVDGAIIVSTPQDVALVDARKGVSMFRKVSVPILGLMLNMSHFTCPSSTSSPAHRHEIFGPLDSFHQVAANLSLPVLGELPLVPLLSAGGDAGRPLVLSTDKGAEETKKVMGGLADFVWTKIV